MNARDREGRTPVYIACDFLGGDPLLLMTLVSQGADVDTPDFNGKTPAHVAAANGGILKDCCTFFTRMLRLRAAANSCRGARGFGC